MSVFTCIYVLEESLGPDDVIETLNISDTQKRLKETDERLEESSHEISAMGNTKSLISEREEGEMKSEISADTEKEEKDSGTAVEQVVNIIVDTGDQHEISENIKKENLQMFITPPGNSDIKTVGDDAIEKQVTDTNIDLCPVNSPTLTAPESESKSLKSIITENIRIVRKLPSFSHDEISQMSVKLVKEILSESEDDEEIQRRLESLQLIYFTKSDKTEFWSSKEEIMNRIVMDTLTEDEELDEEEEERAAPLSCGPSDDILTEESTSEGQEDTGCNDNDDSNKSAETLIVDSKDKDELKGTDQMKSSSPGVHENTLTLNDPQENLENEETLEEDAEVRSDKTIERSADDITQSPRYSNKKDVESVDQNTNVENEEVENELSKGTTEDLTESEEERTNLIGIINRNISKLCRQQDYSQNETAQRKVRTLFNIITESTTAEEIYDKIQLEGLQYFAEYQTDTDRDQKNENTERDSSASASKSPSVSRTEKDRDNSIVSKILGEVMSPRQNKPREGAVNLDQTEEEMDKKEEEISGEEVVKKEEAIAGEDVAEEDTNKKDEEISGEDKDKKEKIAGEDMDRKEKIAEEEMDRKEKIAGEEMDRKEKIAEEDIDRKEEDIAEEDLDNKEEEIADQGMNRKVGKTLSRDKASRRVRKFVR